MRTLRMLVITMLVAIPLLGLPGCVSSQRSYSPRSSDAQYWKKQYERERSRNKVKDFTRGLKGFNRGLDAWNKSMEDANRRTGRSTRRLDNVFKRP